jgi:hypothetical protein
MQNRTSLKPNKLTSFFVSIAMIFDGISTLFFGGLFWVISGLADPVFDTKETIMLRGNLMLLLTFAYLIVCFISLNYWKKGKHFWAYVILILGLSNLAGYSYLFAVSRAEFDFFIYLFFGSLILNLPLVAFILYNEIKSKITIKDNKA